MAEISEVNINGSLYPIKDSESRDNILSIAEAIVENNSAVGLRINNLNTRLTTVETTIADADLLNLDYSGELSEDYEISMLSGSYLGLAAGDSYETAFGKIERSLLDISANSGNANVIESISLNSSTLSVSNKNVNILLKTINNNSISGTGNVSIATGDANVIESISLNSTTQSVLSKNVNLLFKTVNNESIIGSGNVSVGDANIIESISINSATQSVSSKNVNIALKTINGNSIVGSGNISIAGTGEGGGDVNIIESISVNSTAQTVTDKNVNLLFKTINSNSIVGTGDVTIATGDTNVIESISVNSATQSISSKNVNITVPTKISDLTNDLKTLNRKRSATVSNSTVTVEPYYVNDLGTVTGSVTVTFNTSNEVTGYCADYSIRFVAGSNCAITLPNGCLYNGGAAPTYVTGHTYEINISDNLVVVGEFY